MKPKRSLSDICEELCPGVKARNVNAFKRDPERCAHGLKLAECESPMCRPAAPVEGVERVTDDREPIDEIMTRIYRRFREWSSRKFSADDVTWCEVRADVLEIIRTSDARPAKHADDRPAETIPDNLKVRHAFCQQKEAEDPVANWHYAVERKHIEELGRAETRIEVLEAALRSPAFEEVFQYLLDIPNDEQNDDLDQMRRRFRDAMWSIRAALPAPSGDKAK